MLNWDNFKKISFVIGVVTGVMAIFAIFLFISFFIMIKFAKFNITLAIVAGAVLMAVSLMICFYWLVAKIREKILLDKALDKALESRIYICRDYNPRKQNPEA